MRWIVLLAVVFVAACGESGNPSAVSSGTPPTQPGVVSPLPIAVAPVVLTGSGDMVTAHFTLAKGDFKVSWNVVSSQGFAFLIADMHKPGTSDSVNVINASATTGSTLFNANGGEYYLAISNADNESWTITFEKA